MVPGTYSILPNTSSDIGNTTSYALHCIVGWSCLALYRHQVLDHSIESRHYCTMRRSLKDMILGWVALVLGAVLTASMVSEFIFMLYMRYSFEYSDMAYDGICGWTASIWYLALAVRVGVGHGKNQRILGMFLLDTWAVLMAVRGDEMTQHAMKAAVVLVSGHDTVEVRVDVIWWVKVALQYVMARTFIAFAHSHAAQARDHDLEEVVVGHDIEAQWADAAVELGVSGQE